MPIGQMVGQEIHEHPHLDRYKTPLHPDRLDIQLPGEVVIEHRLSVWRQKLFGQ